MNSTGVDFPVVCYKLQGPFFPSRCLQAGFEWFHGVAQQIVNQCFRGVVFTGEILPVPLENSGQPNSIIFHSDVFWIVDKVPANTTKITTKVNGTVFVITLRLMAG